MANDDPNRAFLRYRARGRPEDLACVFDHCAPQLLLFASHVAAEPGVAEDLVQLTFLRAIEGADKFESGRPVLPWLIGILVLEAKKQRRQRARVPDPARLRAPVDEVPLDAAELQEFRDALTRALEVMPAAYREVLTLRLIHGLTPTEIAHARGASPETVKTQLRRGTERLRRILPASFASAVALLTSSVRDLSPNGPRGFRILA